MKRLGWTFGFAALFISAVPLSALAAAQPVAVLSNYADIAAAAYEDSTRSAREMEKKIGDLIAGP